MQPVLKKKCDQRHGCPFCYQCVLSVTSSSSVSQRGRVVMRHVPSVFMADVSSVCVSVRASVMMGNVFPFLLHGMCFGAHLW